MYTKERGFVSAEQVAQLAGVSRSAVSRTFTDGASVSEATRKKVQQAAEFLGYHVNHLARASPMSAVISWVLWWPTCRRPIRRA